MTIYTVQAVFGKAMEAMNKVVKIFGMTFFSRPPSVLRLISQDFLSLIFFLKLYV
jgi:hypothetical protein